ncbi:S5A-REDUCTASE domain-containing protein [Mycena kentingensis (nom. inval.)]|nr:S5A-REDUCTASE domain-containing protein [Mycena kentingensis (nom. inval.)]
MRGEDASDSQWFVPVVVSDPREDVDKAGKPCLVFDCIFNSGVKSLSLRDPLFKTYIQELSLQRIEAQTSLLLSREITTPNIASKGKLLPRTALIPDTLPPPTKPLIEEIPPVPPPKGILKPSTQSLPLPVTTWSWSKMPESGTIEISFPVPLLTRALISRTTVDIEARRVLVFVPSSPPLSIDVNVDVSDAEITARVPGHEAALMLKRFQVPNVQQPALYLPPQLQSGHKEKKSKKNKRGSAREEAAAAYVEGWNAHRSGIGPQPPLVASTQPVAPAVQPTDTARAAPLFTPHTGVDLRTFPPANGVEAANPSVAEVLRPLPPPAPSAYGPPAAPAALPPLPNPLPTPPRDLYELSPYNTLLNLPQTTALLTSNYARMGSVPPPSIDRKKTGRGGILRSLTGRGRKEEDVRFVPVFIGAASTSGNASVAPEPIPVVAAPGHEPPPPPTIAFQDTIVPPEPIVPVDDPWPMATPHPGHAPSLGPTVVPLIYFSGNSYDYAGFLNYSPHRVIYDNREYPTALHLHEAMKFLPVNLQLSERIRLCPDVTQVYHISQDLVDQFGEIQVRPDWAEQYIPLMEEAILHKFRQHADLRDILLRTHPAELVYEDEYDTYWGSGPRGAGLGENNLGKLLSRERVLVLTLMSSPQPQSDVFSANPYLDNPNLTTLEGEVLWEYAKLAQHLKQLRHKTRLLNEQPDAILLEKLRVVENKMGLILTLFKASVWGVINEQNVSNDTTIE